MMTTSCFSFWDCLNILCSFCIISFLKFFGLRTWNPGESAVCLVKLFLLPSVNTFLVYLCIYSEEKYYLLEKFLVQGGGEALAVRCDITRREEWTSSFTCNVHTVYAVHIIDNILTYCIYCIVYAVNRWHTTYILNILYVHSHCTYILKTLYT
jgi:hypothetical protein